MTSETNPPSSREYFPEGDYDMTDEHKANGGPHNDVPTSKKAPARRIPWVSFGRILLVILAVAVGLWLTFKILIITTGALISIVGFRSPVSTPSGPLICNDPVPVDSWQVETMVPHSGWLSKGNPKPIEFKTDRDSTQQIYVVDIDARDTRLEIFANGVSLGMTSDFELDLSANCGDDVNACIQSYFSYGSFVVPPGKQNIKIAWAGKDYLPGTTKIDWRGDRERRFKWMRAICH